MASAAAAPGRRRMLARVHILAKDLGLADDVYRDVLERSTGKRSAGDCDEGELVKAIAALERSAGGPRRGRRPSRTRSQANGAHHRKALALWLALWQLGEVDDPSDAALDAFARRQTGVDSLAWVAGDKAGPVIDALKAWCKRAGFDVPATTGDKGAEAKRRLIRALWHNLCETGAVRITSDEALWRYLDTICSMQAGLPRRAGIEHLDLRQLDIAVEKLGRWLRGARKDASR